MFENDNKVHILDHPLLQHKLSILRDERTGVKEFREIVSEIAALECYEATRDLPTEEVEIKTPVATGTFRVLAGKKLAIVPILRAGLGMVDGILDLIPSAKVGHIGLYRDPETHQPVEYYCKMPSDISERDVIVLDPPRDGIHPKALPKIIEYQVDNLVYISCKPTSLARDLEIFLRRGYRVERCVCVDQFAQTVHTETICHLKHTIEKQ